VELTKVIIVALISLSPIGEELIAIPAGVALGLPVLLAAGVAAVANFLPVPALFFIFDRGNKYPKLLDWLMRRRNERMQKWMNKYGIFGLFVLTPWAGVYAATVTCELLGMKRARISGAIGASLVFYALIIAVLFTIGTDLV
jgi:uncharacterized membrane protein